MSSKFEGMENTPSNDQWLHFLHFRKYRILSVGTDDSKAVLLKRLMHLFKLETLLLSIVPTFQVRGLLIFS